jgi:hypothetical protein
VILERRTESGGREIINQARQHIVVNDVWILEPDADDLEMYDILLFALGQLGVRVIADQWSMVQVAEIGYYQECDDILVGLAHAYLAVVAAGRHVV